MFGFKAIDYAAIPVSSNERENFKSDCKNMEVWKLNELERQENMKRKMNIILTVFLTTLMALGILVEVQISQRRITATLR